MSAQLYKIELRDGVITVTFEKGMEVTPDCIMEVIDRKNKLYDVEHLNAIWDIRGALPSDNFGYDAMEQIIHYIENHPQAQWNPHLALLADTGVQYGLSRMFQLLADQFPIAIRIFDAEDEALKWMAAQTAMDNHKDIKPIEDPTHGLKK